MTWIFVYAAESGWAHAALDWAHKLVSPSTYDCALCQVTYGVFGRKAEWDQALGRLPGDKVFVHRDEFERDYPGRELVAPAVWRVEAGAWTLVVGPDDWNGIDDVAALEARLRAAR